MEISHRKVVTLDEVVKFTDEAHGEVDNRLLFPGNKDISDFHNDSDKQIALIDNDELVLANEEKDEELDQLGGLPEDWPNIPSLFRRRSCLLTNAKSTCVNKATSHLELLQNIIEEWFEDRVSRASRASTKQSIARESSVLSKGRKQLRFKSGFSSQSVPTTAESRTVSADSRMSETSAGSEQLSVQGIGTTVDKDKKQQRVTIQEPDLDIPYLGAEDVIDECITLLARLEKDRIETEDARAREKERVRMLSTRIDNLSQRRMHELPLAVQKEHEACAMDISELQWHVSYKTREEKRIINKHEAAEILNQRLKEDIEFIKKHGPLVQEKVQLEREAMNRIFQAQTKTTGELNVTITRCKNVEQKSDEANAKAQSERAHILADLDQVRDGLQSVNDELSEAIATFNDYISQCTDYQQQLEDNQQELIVLDVKNENSKAAEAIQSKKVKQLEFELNQLRDEQQKLETENRQLLSDKEMRQSKNSAIEKQLKDKVDKAETSLRDVSRKNQESLMDIEDFTTKIEDCARQKIADEKNLVRMNKEMEKTEEQLEMTLDELGKVTTINSAVKEQLQNEKDTSSHLEDQLRMTVDALKKQVKEEIHTRTVIAARITSDGDEIVRTKEEQKDKKVKVEEKVGEVATAVKQVSKKVEKLRSAHADKTKQVNELKARLEEVLSKHKDLETKLSSHLGQIEPQHRQLTEDVLKVNKRLDHMAWRTDMINQKFEDMGGSTQMMNKVIAKTNKSISVLTEEMDELNIQLDSSQKIEDDLKQSLDQVLSRVKINGKQHKELMEERNDVHQQLEADLKASVILNKELASRYRQLQNEFIVNKNKLMNTYDDRVKLETSVKDIKQLQSLQKRMHFALQEYYKYRGAYNKSELTRMTEESHENGAKVSVLQDQMNDALVRITHFLQNTMDVTGRKKPPSMVLEGRGNVAMGVAPASKQFVAVAH